MAEGEHYNDSYIRYHSDIYMPEYILEAAVSFLPSSGALLPLSYHYYDIQKGRHLPGPGEIKMPEEFTVVDVTLERGTPLQVCSRCAENDGYVPDAYCPDCVPERVDRIWRVCIRYPWPSSHLLDMVLVLQEDVGRPTADHEVVSAYWNARDDRHLTLDVERYVESPAKAEFDEARP